MSSNNDIMTNCPANNFVPVPSTIGIHSKSVYVVVPRVDYLGDTPDDWMISCCHPNPVQLAGNHETGTCWQWCNLPYNYTDATSDSFRLMSEFKTRIRSAAGAPNTSHLPSVTLAAAPRYTMADDRVLGVAMV